MATNTHDSGNQKSFLDAKPNTFQKNIVTLLDLEGKENSIPKNLLLRKLLARPNCELKDKNTFPNLREGDTPQRKARVSKLNCKTSRNQIPVWTLVQCCPERQVAVSGAGAGRT